MKRTSPFIYAFLSTFIVGTLISNTSHASRHTTINSEVVEATKKWALVKKTFEEAITELTDKALTLDTILRHSGNPGADPLILDNLFPESSYPEMRIVVTTPKKPLDMIGLHVVKHYKETLEDIRDHFAEALLNAQFAKAHLECLRDSAAQIYQFSEIMKYVSFQLIYKFLGYKPHALAWREEYLDIKTAISENPVNLGKIHGCSSFSPFESDQYLRAGFNSGTTDLPPFFLIGYYNEKIQYVFQNLVSGLHKTLCESKGPVQKRLNRTVPNLKLLPSFVDTTIIDSLSEKITPPSTGVDGREEDLGNTPEISVLPMDTPAEKTSITERSLQDEDLSDSFLTIKTEEIKRETDESPLEKEKEPVEEKPLMTAINLDLPSLIELPSDALDEPQRDEVLEVKEEREQIGDFFEEEMLHNTGEALEELDAIINQFGTIYGMKTNKFLSFIAALEKLGYFNDFAASNSEVLVSVGPSDSYPQGAKTTIHTNHKPSNRRGKGDGLTKNSAKNVKRVLMALRAKIEEEASTKAEEKKSKKKSKKPRKGKTRK